MNKILSSIIGGLLGITMAASVGVATFAGENAKEAKAANGSYTITFANNASQATALSSSTNASTAISSSSTSYVTSKPFTVNSGNCYYGDTKTCIRIGKSGNASDLSIALSSSGSVNASTIVVNCANMGGNKNSNATLSINSKTAQTTTTTASDYTYTINDSISSINLVGSAAIYIYSITVNYTSGGDTPTTYEYTDTLTRFATGVTNGVQTYSSWSGVKLTSSAVYAGKSGGLHNSIQINATNKDSGIITTASGGTVKSIKVVFNTNTTASTTNARIFHAYGKESAYSSAADLFSSEAATKGASIGTATYVEGTTEYTITPSSNYTFVGFRMGSNPGFIDSIAITWETTTAVAGVSSIAITTNPTTMTFGVGQTLSLEGMVVTATYSDSTSGATVNFSASPYEGYVFVAGDVGSKTLTVTSSADTTKTASITLTIVSAFPKSITRTSPAVYSNTMKLNEGTGRFKVTLTDDSEITNVKVGDTNTELFIGGSAVDVTALAATYANQNATIKYTQIDVTVQYTFKIVVEDDLLVDHFDDVPEYVLSGDSATIEAHYTSFIGKPTATVVSLESEYLSVSFNQNNVTYDSTTYIGEIPFTVTGGTTAGQYTVKVTIEKDGETSSNTCSIIVRTAEPGHEGSGDYELVTNSNDITTGKYVIAANVSGTYYAMNTTAPSSGKIGKDTITVQNDVVTSSSFTVFDLEKSGNGYYIKSNTSYLKYTSSTNISFNGTQYLWTIAAGTKGTWRINSETSGRALVYRAGTSNVYGGYATSNVTAAGTEYYDVELFKYSGSEEEDTGAAEFELVKTFVDTYMHMNDIAVSNTNDTGACRGSNGYYALAKAGWNTLVASYSGDADDLKDIFEEKFPDAYARYLKWAEKNNDSNPWDGNAAPSSSKGPIAPLENSNATITVVIVASLITMTMVAAYITLRKKKEVK